MRRPLAIFSMIGIVAMCVLLAAGTLMFLLMPSGQVIRLGTVENLEFKVCSQEIFIFYRNTYPFVINLFYAGVIIGFLPIVYFLISTTRDRRARGFSVLMQQSTNSDVPKTVDAAAGIPIATRQPPRPLHE